MLFIFLNCSLYTIYKGQVSICLMFLKFNCQIVNEGDHIKITTAGCLKKLQKKLTLRIYIS